MQDFDAASARELQKVQIQQAADKQIKTITDEIKRVCTTSETPSIKTRSENLNSVTRKWFSDNGYTVEYEKVGTFPPNTFTRISW